jgi:signal transduction histidine kinase
MRVGAVRKVFSTPRLAEFATRQGLTTRVGLDPEWWPEVALKELIDNAIDDAETHGLPPIVTVDISDDAIIVEDRGSGVAPGVVARIFDYDRQTSSRDAYVEPTRGAQGNALQPILAMPYVLSGERGELVIESRGVRHDLWFTVDPVTAQPVIEHERAPSEVTEGTRVTVTWPSSLAAIVRASRAWRRTSPSSIRILRSRSMRTPIRRLILGGGSASRTGLRWRAGTAANRSSG